jgi:hypothetical protein
MPIPIPAPRKDETMTTTDTDTVAAVGRIEHQALLAPVSGRGRFIVVLSSSVCGELARRSAPGRMPAFAEAVRMLRERAAAETSNTIRRRCMAKRSASRSSLRSADCLNFEAWPARGLCRCHQRNFELGPVDCPHTFSDKF